jgi:hypothetical protein
VGLCRVDVLVEPLHIFGVVLFLDFHQSGIVRSVRRPDKLFACFAELVGVLTSCGFSLIEGVVRGAHQRAGFYVFEAHRFAAHFVLGKFIGMNVTNNREMFARGLQILAEREDVGALCGKVLHAWCVSSPGSAPRQKTSPAAYPAADSGRERRPTTHIQSKRQILD